MAQFTKQSLTLQEVQGSNPVIGEIQFKTFRYQLKSLKNEEKEADNSNFLQKNNNCVWRLLLPAKVITSKRIMQISRNELRSPLPRLLHRHR